MTKTFAPSPTTSKRSHRLKTSPKLSSTSHRSRAARKRAERAGGDGGARSQCCSMRVGPPLNPSPAQPLSPSRSAFGARFSPRLSSPTCSLSDAAGEREMYLPRRVEKERFGKEHREGTRERSFGGRTTKSNSYCSFDCGVGFSCPAGGFDLFSLSETLLTHSLSSSKRKTPAPLRLSTKP